MQVTADIDISLVNLGIDGLIRQVGLNERTVIAKETGELIKTLSRISPPESRATTNKNIQRDITGKFNRVGDSNMSNSTGTKGDVGPSGILWYMVNPNFLFGIAPEKDMRRASIRELERLRWTLTKKGNQKLPFRSQRKHQQVLLSQSILTKVSTVNKLIAQARSHVGRLKAAWLTATLQGNIKLSGSNMPPNWVTKQLSFLSKGRFDDKLADPKFPRFMVANFARGIGHRAARRLFQKAADIRGKAIQTNISLFLSGKKRLSDYA